jgi:hypothetical protein
MAGLDPGNLAHYWGDQRTRDLRLMRADFHTQEYALHRLGAFVIAVTEIGAVIKNRGVLERADASALCVLKSVRKP